MTSFSYFCHSYDVTYIPRESPALRAIVGQVAAARRHSFILLLFVSHKLPDTGPHSFDTLLHNTVGVVG